MDIGTVFKLLALVLWPFVFLLLYFLLDRKGFMKKVDKIKQQGFK
jgi:cell shape-determining protein MreD